MERLFSTYSLSQIVTFIIVLALAIKELGTFLDWLNTKIRLKADKDDEPKQLAKKLEKAIQTREEEIRDLKYNESELKRTLNELSEKMELLIASDKDDIKAWITAQHHRFIEKGHIDYYSLDCIQRRYQHYKAEDGNSFIDGLMEEIRQLPME